MDPVRDARSRQGRVRLPAVLKANSGRVRRRPIPSTARPATPPSRSRLPATIAGRTREVGLLHIGYSLLTGTPSPRFVSAVETR